MSHNRRIPTNLPAPKSTIPPNRIPGPMGVPRTNVVPPGVPGNRPIAQPTHFSAPAESSTLEKPTKEYSDEDQQNVSSHGEEEESHLRPEAGEEPEIKERKARFGLKNTDEEDNPDETEGIENEEDTPRNLMSLSESLKAMKNLRSNFQSFQYEAETHEYEDKHIDKEDKEFEDEDYVKVESGEEDNIHDTEKDFENEEQYDEEDYYDRARASGSFSKGHYIEKIHEELHEESHRGDDEEDVQNRPLYTEEEDREERLQSQREETEGDVIPISSRQDLQEQLRKHSNQEEEDKGEDQIQLIEYEEVKQSDSLSHDIINEKDKIKDEKDKFFEELEQGGAADIEIKHHQDQPLIASQTPDLKDEEPQKEEIARKSDNFEHLEPKDVSPQARSSVQIIDEPPQKEEKPQQEVELPQKSEDVPPPMGIIPAPRRNVPPQRGQVPPQRGNIPMQRGNMPPLRPNIPGVQKMPAPLQREPESPQKETLPSQIENEQPQKEEKPEAVNQSLEPPQREKEPLHQEIEPPTKTEDDIPPPKTNAPPQTRNVPPQRGTGHQAPKFFMPTSSQQEDLSSQPAKLSQPQNLGSPFQTVAQRTASDIEYEAKIAATAQDASENALLVRLKKVEIELKKEKQKNEFLETEREKVLFESKDLKQQIIDLKSQLEHSQKKDSSDLFSQKEQETMEKLRQELKTTVEGSRLVTEHSNKIIAESEKYKQEMETRVDSLEEEKKQLQKTILELKAQVHEEQLKVETQQQKTEFFEKKAREYEESFDLVSRQLNERMDAFKKLTSINEDVQTAIQTLPQVETFLAKLQPQTNTVAVQTISSQLTSTKSLSPNVESSSPIQHTRSSTKAPQTTSAPSQVKEPIAFGLSKSGLQSSEKKTQQEKVKETSNEFVVSPQVKEEPKSKPISSSVQEKNLKDKDEEVTASQSSDNWFDSVFTSQTVRKTKDPFKPIVQPTVPKVQEEKDKESVAKPPKEKAVPTVPKVQEEKEKEQEKESPAKPPKEKVVPTVPKVQEIKEKEQDKESPARPPKEEVVSASKPSLQADDFFKDLVSPSTKPSLAPEFKIPSETKVKSPVKLSSPIEKVNPKELEKTETEKVSFKAQKVDEKAETELQAPEPSIVKAPQTQKEQTLKTEEAKSSVITPKEEPKVQKPILNLPQAKPVVPQFAKTGTSEQGPKKIGPVILPKMTTSEQAKPLNLGNIQTKSGNRYAQTKKSIDQNFIAVESDSFFGELGLGDSSANKMSDPFKGSLRESTSSLRTSKQGVDPFAQPVVKKKALQ